MALGEGLTQGQATIIAAGIAVGAASIAFLGILVTARSDRAWHEATLGAGRAAQHRQPETEALYSALGGLKRVVGFVSMTYRNMDRYVEGDCRGSIRCRGGT